jgi:uncharacterized protein YdaU (DUF1376 family)
VAEFPALQLWTDAYLGDTLHLSTIEHGAYLLLLMAAWRTKDCRLPDDDRMLAKYARLTPGQWARIKPTIAGFYTIENGFWVQGRLTDERDAVRRKSERGKAGADAKWLKHNKTRHAQASPKHMPNDANHNHNHNHKDTNVSSPPKSPKGDGAFDLPDWVPAEAWAGFVEMRRGKRAYPTARAVKLIVAELEKLRAAGHEPGAVLDQSTANNWTDVYALKGKKSGQAAGGGVAQVGF